MKNKTMAVAALTTLSAFGLGFGSGKVNWAWTVNAHAGQPAFRVSDAAAGAMLEVVAGGTDLGASVLSINDAGLQPGVPLFRVGDLLDNHGPGAAALAVHDRIYFEGDTFAHGDITIATADYGLVLTAPDGSMWRVLVDNDGTLSTAEVE